MDIAKVKNIKLERKQKFWVNSAIAGVILFLLSIKAIPLTIPILFIVGLGVIAGVFVVHYPNLNVRNIIIGCILPLNLYAGAIMTFYFFPNLSMVFKVFSGITFTVLYYIVSLVDNIFLVVNERKETIPLYRVAITWGYILVVLLAIPVFAGIYKIPVYSLVQALAISVISCVFAIYLIWAGTYDAGSKNMEVGESLLIMLFLFVVLLGSALCVSFLPTEAFLKGLFLSSVLMFMLTI